MADETDSLIVGSTFDPSGFTAGLAAGEAQFDNFAARVQRQLDIPAPEFNAQEFTADVVAMAQQAHESLVAGLDVRTEAGALARQTAETLETQLLGTLGSLRTRLENGIIDPPRFQALARLAVQSFQTGMEGLVVNVPVEVNTAGLIAQTEQAVGQAQQVTARNPVRPVFDASEFTADIIAAADVGRNALSRVIDRRQLTEESALAAHDIADQLQAGLLERVGGLREALNQGLMSEADFRRQADAALAAFSEEMSARIKQLLPIPIKVRPVVDRAQQPEVISEDEFTQAIAASPGGRIGQKGGVNQLAELEAQIKAVKADMQAGITTNREYANSLDEIRQSAIQMREQGLVQGDKSLAGFNRVMIQTENRVKEGAVAMRQMRLGAAQLAVQAIGTEGAVGQLAQGLLIFGGGSALVVGVGLGIAAIVGFYEQMTKKAHEAEKANNDLVESGRKRIEGPDESGLQAEAAAAARRLVAATKARRDLEHEIFLFGTDFLAVMNRQYLLGRVIEEQNRSRIESGRLNALVLEDNVRHVAELTAQYNQQRQTVEQTSSAIVQALAAAPALGTATVATFTEMRIRTEEIRDRIRSGNEDQITRNRLQGEYNSLIQAANQPLSRQVDLTTRSVNEQLQTLQRLKQQAEQFGAPVTLRLDVSNAADNLDERRTAINQEIAALRVLEDRYRNNSVLLDTFTAKRRGLEQLRDSITDVVHAFEVQPIQEAVNQMTRAVESLNQLPETELEFIVPVHLDEQPVFAQLEQMQRDIQRELDTFSAAGVEPPAETVRLFQQVSQAIRDSINAPIEALNRSAALVLQRMQAVQSISETTARTAELESGHAETIGELSDRLRGMEPVLDELRNRYEAVTTEIERQKAAGRDVIDLLQTQSSLLQAMSQFQPPTPLETTQIEPLQEATQRLIEARNDLTIASESGSRAAVASATANVRVQTANVLQLRKNILDTLNDLNVHGPIAARILDLIDQELQRAGVSVNRLSQGTLEWIDALNQVGQTIGDIARLGDQLGIMGEEGDEAARGIQQAVQAAAQFASGDIIGGIISAGAALANLGQALFGQDATQQEHNSILEANNQALDRNTAALERSTTAGGLETLLQDIQEAFRGRSPSGLGTMEDVFRSFEQFDFTGGANAANALDEILHRAGSSLDELEEIARKNGIELLDSKGRLVAGAFDQLRERLEQVQIEMTSFGDTIDDQSRRNELRSRLAGIEQDPQEQFRQLVATFSDFSPAIADMFSKIDLGNDSQVRSSLSGLFEKFDEGFFTAHPELFGNLTKDQFLDFLSQGADYLDTFGDKVNDASEQLGSFNLPRGFREAALAFANADLGRPDTTPPPPPVAETITPTVDVMRQANRDVVVNLDTANARLSDLIAGITNVATHTPDDSLAAMADMIAGITRVSEQTPDDLLAALEGLRGTVQDKAGATQPSVTNIHVNVPAGTTAITPQMKQDITDSVVAGLHRKGLQQTNNTMQVRIR